MTRIRGKAGLMLGLGGLFLTARAVTRQRRFFELRDKTVLITGGSRGLGLVLARRFAALGAKLALCARDPAELEQAQRELEANGAAVFTVPCDVTDNRQVEAAVKQVRDHHGSIDVLVNNAGVIEVGPMETMTLADYEEAMNTHFYGPLHMTLAVLPELRRQGRGRIINIASIGGVISVPHLLPYSASKFALVGLSRGLRAALSKDDILVTTVTPGLMRTGSPRNAIFKGQHRAEYTWFSISDSLPLISMSAEQAAERIVSACQTGEAELVLSLPARVAALAHGLFPGITAEILSLVNRLLPGPGGIGTTRASGAASQSPLSPSLLTTLSDQAARRNNQIAGP